MNIGETDICIKVGIFMLILSIICRIAVGILYKVLACEAQRIEKTKNPVLCRLRKSLHQRVGSVRGQSKKRICAEQCLREVKAAGISLFFLPRISFYCMLLAILTFGIGAYQKIINGMFLIESFPFYIATFAGVYVYLFIASFTDYEASRELLKEELVNYLDELETTDFHEIGTMSEEPEEIRVGNLTKKSRNREKEKLLKEFLS